MTAMRKTWNMDRASSRRDVKKDADRAVEVLLEEGYQFIDTGIRNETFTRVDDAGVKETVVLFHELANGTMLFTKEGSEDPRRVMAWDYVREMRPNLFQKSVKSVKRKLRLV